ncbi:hypothetical protein ACFIJ5_07165 [Haloimpatiens sp. FM7330]|uniref:hypothetical protein n=1 Tax=Haloimpatiens sp. FM7330 TaxID=3298610 RepID=UPI00364596B3
MDEKIVKAKELLNDTLSRIEVILDEKSPTGLDNDITCNDLDKLIEALDKVSIILDKYSK